MPTHPVIQPLIDDHLSGVPDSEKDRKFLEEGSQEFYVATVAEARDYLRQWSILTWDAKRDEYCARIGFLRAVTALARAKMGKSFRPARIMSS
ncbi:hypothetical protein A2853_01275 [Candidatus Kaiserbacteria bacterium RIFCSPHIGHO2_01_FULL_55_17]|uniref:Uncharacterized protein n=1 Tax=Candidatus Kaiserbacteria bacterium RIFCSPHIGHO2_01_FULL_55_17 TaxID=1798484 RepID=A0A1F6D9L0_9BACT|nr:MAG: hypothetical protein A2853_01275 [Candidatus Kaiserbacteria bacterium RIFCSPHIGHO2_01_FULL_55_17]